MNTRQCIAVLFHRADIGGMELDGLLCFPPRWQQILWQSEISCGAGLADWGPHSVPALMLLACTRKEILKQMLPST